MIYKTEKYFNVGYVNSGKPQIKNIVKNTILNKTPYFFAMVL